MLNAGRTREGREKLARKAGVPLVRAKTSCSKLMEITGSMRKQLEQLRKRPSSLK